MDRDFIVILVYVNDLFLAISNHKLLNAVFQDISESYKMSFGEVRSKLFEMIVQEPKLGTLFLQYRPAVKKATGTVWNTQL